MSLFCRTQPWWLRGGTWLFPAPLRLVFYLSSDQALNLFFFFNNLDLTQPPALSCVWEGENRFPLSSEEQKLETKAWRVEEEPS